MRHRKAQIRFFTFRLKRQLIKRFDGAFFKAAGQNMEGGVFIGSLLHHLRGQHFLLAPNDQVLERMANLVFPAQPQVQWFDAVDHANKQVRVKLPHLVKVKRRKQPMPPAKGCVSIDDDVFVFFALGDDVFDHAAAK